MTTTRIKSLIPFFFGLALSFGCDIHIEVTEAESDGDGAGDGNDGADDDGAGDADDGDGGNGDDGVGDDGDDGVGDDGDDGDDDGDDDDGNDGDDNGDDDGVESVPNGGMCNQDADCESSRCYHVGALGGICGECNSDEDCEAGCTAPDAIWGEGAYCNDGGFGEGCASSAVCDGDLVCGPALEVQDISANAVCSECVDDSDCIEAGHTCQPTTVDLNRLTEARSCVGPDQLADGSSCNPATGDAACASGHCLAASLMGLAEFGICSACASDLDCAEATECLPPQVDLSLGLIPGACG